MQALYAYFVEDPLKIIYRYGALFWAGKDLLQICSEMTDTDIELWRTQPKMCLEQYTRAETGFLVMAYAVVYFWALFVFLKWVVETLLLAGSATGHFVTDILNERRLGSRPYGLRPVPDVQRHDKTGSRR